MRTVKKYTLEHPEQFKQNLLEWTSQFDDVMWLDSNKYQQQYSNYDAVLAVDAFTGIQTDYHNAFEQFKEYQTLTNDWVFGYLSYDLKNDLEHLKSNNHDGLQFPDLYFFQPKKLFFIKDNQLEMHYLRMVDDEIQADFATIIKGEIASVIAEKDPIKIQLRIHKDAYFSKIETMLGHIKRGDIYEANFCQEFYSENATINPLQTYKKLNAISKPPFATYLKLNDKFLMSASPERYIKKEGTKIVSQPIKGTAKRDPDFIMDQILKNDLVADQKERSENVMIVDLVRNDLSHTAVKGSVKVEELCQLYTFDQVHQMISTVTSEVEKTTHPIDIIKTTFPMGSMTGAPKISAMKIVEDLEETKRGLYSGAVGYISPDGDFDFNVVIRSILYNKTNQYVSYSVGGAITAKSIPLNEYEECLVKAKAMRTVLEN